MTDKTPRKALSPPIGTPGLPTFGGFVYDEPDRRFQGDHGKKAIREAIDGDSTVGAIRFAMESLIRHAGYVINAADESPEADEVKSFVEECFLDMRGSPGELLSAIVGCCWWGFSLFELSYKFRNGYDDDPDLDSAYDDGKIGWRRWGERAQETILRWEFDPVTWEATAAVQWAPPSYQMATIPLSKCVLFHARQTKQNPEGSSLLRSALDALYYAKNIRRLEAIGIERDFTGVIVLDLPDEVFADAEALGRWTKIITDFRRNEQDGIAIPSTRDEQGNRLYDVRLLSTPGTRTIDTDKVLARYERLILRSVLADFLTLGDQGVGSHAQSRNRSDLFITAVASFLDAIADAITSQAIRPLLRVNGIDPKLQPTFQFKAIAKRDTYAFAQTIDLMIKDNVVDPSDPELRRFVYEELDLPLPAVTFEEAANEQIAQGQIPGNLQAAQDATQQQQAQSLPTGPTGPAQPPAKAQPATAMQASDPAPVPVTIGADEIREALAFWDATMKDHAGMLAAKAA